MSLESIKPRGIVDEDFPAQRGERSEPERAVTARTRHVMETQRPHAGISHALEFSGASGGV